jgi:hypothetical protein
VGGEGKGKRGGEGSVGGANFGELGLEVQLVVKNAYLKKEEG